MTSDTFTGWRKATYSHGNGDCVEVATGRSGVGIRDTVQQGHGPVLQFTAEAWRVFIGTANSCSA
jgi:Domain of unknown function (DUF397)